MLHMHRTCGLCRCAALHRLPPPPHVAPSSARPPLPSLCGMFVGPLMVRHADTCPAVRHYMRRKMGPPGGAVCVGAPNLAQCTRFEG